MGAAGDVGGVSSGGRDGNAGSWAAAALVVALGALCFAVVTEIRYSNLQDRVSQLETRTDPLSQLSSGSVTTSPIAGGAAHAPSSTATAATGNGQPESPEEARADVVAAFTSAYDGTKPLSERLAQIDDPAGVDAAITSASAGQFGGAAASSRITISQVVFTSPSAATVNYDVLAGGTPALLNRVGTARLVAGTWKVTRATICADLETAGGTCSG